ncbi:aspartyl-phosphate phosphatase Spo0E family protein [Halalkalibacter urbisdiaboli]|uniref:aspartyl-phosphate phosphatase Spo0E family protein n=1 Tax=Halalkalibacter urbisdiaboli TaxID=1960589 RepID=UPI000B449A77|nr:aspartyl-phosphate phosphatase Spo0E family protein [Halalkalibacter urbisdiaboli]
MLLTEIELKRRQMLHFAKKYGFTSEKTVQCSQELDLLLNLVQFHPPHLNMNK